MVGLGGGSNMDLAKIAATLLAHGGTPQTFVGDDRIPGPITPLICVPTTAGTGSEVSAASVLTDTENKMKVGILSNYLRPRVAIVDPLLTVSCPPRVTADSGIDALTHAIEAYTAVANAEIPLPEGERSVYQGKHPMGDMVAEKAITLIGKHLRRAVSHPDDLAAREGMALGATLAGLAFPTSASRWCMPSNIPSAAPRIARMAPATGCCSPLSCGSICRRRFESLPRSHGSLAKT